MLLTRETSACCPYCGRRDVVVYLRGHREFGCSACLGAFFERLPPTERPWRMTLWNDVKSFFRPGASA